VRVWCSSRRITMTLFPTRARQVSRKQESSLVIIVILSSSCSPWDQARTRIEWHEELMVLEERGITRHTRCSLFIAAAAAARSHAGVGIARTQNSQTKRKTRPVPKLNHSRC
jgi:hypothetical protein